MILSYILAHAWVKKEVTVTERNPKVPLGEYWEGEISRLKVEHQIPEGSPIVIAEQ